MTSEADRIPGNVSYKSIIRQGEISGALFNWKKMKKKDIPGIEDLLFSIEENYVSACGRFLARNDSKDIIWLLRNKNDICSLIINSRSTVIPVLAAKTPLLYSRNELINQLIRLKSFFKTKNIHSVQGLKEEVIIMEEAINHAGKKPVDTIDYDLMSLDKLPVSYTKFPNLVLKIPQLTDIDAIAPLQAAYEQEEVIPKGSVFSPAASRANISNIIANGRILAAQLDGRMIGKINVSAVSFTRYLVGGVYVHRDFRGLGIARRMASEFIASLINEGKAITLFVKKNNIAARRLYAGLGFTANADYRIIYY